METDAVFISALDEIAWLLNIRSADVKYNPVATAFLMLAKGAEGNILYIDADKLTPETSAYLQSQGVSTRAYAEIPSALKDLPGIRSVLIDPARTAEAIYVALGDKAVIGASPVALPKACKTDVQIRGIRNAMIRDGVAMVKSLQEIERRMGVGEKTTELDIDAILLHYRSQQPLFKDISFGTIAGYGAHGAIVHYEADEESSATLERHGLLLIDSGAQYLDGTTDLTRTIALGEPTAQERTDFTLVMKGHIALAQMVFPDDTRGDQLDAIARQFLWKHGLSYLHGTGHGVGYFLNVHEGPQSIRLNHVPQVLRPGMLTSNEPGLYRAGVHGIRCENLVLCHEKMKTEFGTFLCFETVTLCPFDRTLFDTAIMTDDEIRWVNDYHRHVYETLSEHLDNEADRQWLQAKTAPIER